MRKAVASGPLPFWVVEVLLKFCCFVAIVVGVWTYAL